jgi:hypothetical protein
MGERRDAILAGTNCYAWGRAQEPYVRGPCIVSFLLDCKLMGMRVWATRGPTSRRVTQSACGELSSTTGSPAADRAPGCRCGRTSAIRLAALCMHFGGRVVTCPAVPRRTCRCRGLHSSTVPTAEGRPLSAWLSTARENWTWIWPTCRDRLGPTAGVSLHSC